MIAPYVITSDRKAISCDSSQIETYFVNTFRNPFRGCETRLPRLLRSRRLAMTDSLLVIARSVATKRSRSPSQWVGECVGKANLGSQTKKFAKCVGKANLGLRLRSFPYGKLRNDRGFELPRPPSAGSQ